MSNTDKIIKQSNLKYYDGKSKNYIEEKITSHTTNKNNPHNVTLQQLGYDETISSATQAELDKLKQSIIDVDAINEASGEIICLADTAKGTLSELKIYGKSTQNQYTGKNLLPYPYVHTTKTANGITWTDLGDGTIIATGINTLNTGTTDLENRNGFICSSRDDGTNKPFILPAGTYMITGCLNNGSIETYHIEVGKTGDNNSFSLLAYDYGNGAIFTLTEETQVQVILYIGAGYDISSANVTNVTFKPMISNINLFDFYFKDGWVRCKDYSKNGNSVTFAKTEDSSTGPGISYYYADYYPKNGATYNVSAKINTDEPSGGFIRIAEFLNDGTFNIIVDSQSSTSNCNVSCTVPSDLLNLSYIRILFVIKNQSAPEGTQITFSDILVKEETPDKTYEPYVGLKASPSFDYPQEIVNVANDGVFRINSIGKNLIPYPYVNTSFSKDGITWTDLGDGRIKANGTAEKDTAFLLSKFKVPAGKYTGSGSINVENVAIQLSHDAIYDMGSTWYKPEITATYSDEVFFNYCRILIKEGVTVDNEIFEPMLRHADIEDGTYEPFKSITNEIPISKSLRSIKDIKDEIVCIDGKYNLIKRIGRIIFDGSSDEKWATNSKYPDRFYILGENIDNLKPNTRALCSHYSWCPNIENVEYGIAIGQNLNFRNKDITTLADWKASLQANPITVEYVLNEEVIEVFENQDIFKVVTYDRATCFTNTDETELWVQYYSSSNVGQRLALVNKEMKEEHRFLQEQITTHVNNTNLHISNEDRTLWTNKAGRDEVIGENLIPYPYFETTRTYAGITYTDNGDGTITISGKSTGSFYIYRSRNVADTNPLILPAGTYIVSGCPNGGSFNTYFLQVSKNGNDGNNEILGNDYGNGVTITLTKETQIQVGIVVNANCPEISNIKFYAMLEKGSVAHPYQPYNLSRQKLRYDIDTSTIGENIIPFPYVNNSVTNRNGVDWTVLEDTSVKANGTASTYSDFLLIPEKTLEAGNYTISGIPSGASSSTYIIFLNWYKDGTYVKTTSFTQTTTFNLSENDVTTYTFRLGLRVCTNGVANNVIFRPMLEKGSVAHEYQPYILSRKGIIEQIVVDNILTYPYVNTTKTVQGVTYTDVGDGTVKVSGTPTANSNFVIRSRKFTDVNNQFDDNNQLILPAGTYTLSGCPKGGKLSTYYLQCGTNDADGNALSLGNDYGDGVTFTLTKETVIQVLIVVDSRCPATNVVFKPILEVGTVVHQYQPYSENKKGIMEQIIADNLLPYPYTDTTQTVEGITFTDLGDGRIQMNGTATADAIFKLSPVYLKAGTYTMSVSDNGFDSNKCNVQLSNSANNIWWGIKNASGVNTYTLTEDLLFNYNRIIVKSGYTVNNVIWSPMVEVGAVAHSYQPYNLSRQKLREDVDKVKQVNTTTSANYRVLLSTNANDTDETNTIRKSANFTANPNTGAFFAKGFDRIDITGKTLDVNTLTLASGSPHIMRYICKTSGGSSNITNIPVTGQPFILDVEVIRWASATDYITRQTFTSIGDKHKEYVRYCTSGTWESNWTKRLFTDNNTTYGAATTTANGLMSSTDKAKLDGIATGAEVNQNAFSNVKVGSVTVAADSKTDTLTLAGSNVTLTPDATNDKVTIGITKSNVTTALGYTPKNNRYALVGQSGSTSTNPWYKFASADLTVGNTDYDIIFAVRQTYYKINDVGILKAHVRADSTIKYAISSFGWLSVSSSINPSDFVLAYKNTTVTNADNTTSNVLKVELWVKCSTPYAMWHFDVISEGSRVSNNNFWSLYTTMSAGSQASIPSDYTQIESTVLELKNDISGKSKGIVSTDATQTWLAGNQGKALVNFDGSHGSFVALSRLKSTNGYFCDSIHQGNRYLTYTSKETVDANENKCTHTVKLLDESGNTSFPGTVYGKFNGSLTGNADSATRATNANGIKSNFQSSNVTNNTYYNIPYSPRSTKSGDTTLNHDESFLRSFQYGTTSAVGQSGIILGNSTKSGTAGNTRGALVMYDTNDKLGTLRAGNGTLTANRNYYLPDQTGTIPVWMEKASSSASVSLALATGRNYIVFAYDTTTSMHCHCVVIATKSGFRIANKISEGTSGTDIDIMSLSGNSLTITMQYSTKIIARYLEI